MNDFSSNGAGLYRESFEKDSCGVGFVANIKGRKSHQIINDGLVMLERMAHRGACGCEANTGDGAGILIQVPHEFFISECSKLQIKLPAFGAYGVGLVFFPADATVREECRTVLNRQIKKMVSSYVGENAIFMPGMPGWLDKAEQDYETLKPDSFKGYTIGDNTNKHLARHPWHLDDEKLLYPFYEKLVKWSKVKPSLANVCVHKGLFPPSTTKQFPHLLQYADVRDVGKAAKDFPELNFIIYHSGFRFTGGAHMTGWEQFEQTGRIDWVTDLADIPQKYGVKNVYGDLGQIFAQSTLAEPRLCAAMMGQLVKGLGADHIVWGSDAVWTGAPQWQIEGLRRLEIPVQMQEKYGFAPLGAADGPVKNAIFGEIGRAHV